MTLGSDVTGARTILYGNPATGNDWYGFGMNGSAINCNNIATGTHKFYCGTTVVASISRTTVHKKKKKNINSMTNLQRRLKIVECFSISSRELHSARAVGYMASKSNGAHDQLMCRNHFA